MRSLPASHWLLAPQACRVLPGRPYPRAGRDPPRLPPPAPVLFVRLLSGVAGATLDLCPAPGPPTSAPFHALDTAAGPVSCMSRALGWKPVDGGVCRHPEPSRFQVFPPIPAVGAPSWLYRGSRNADSAAGLSESDSCPNLPCGDAQPGASGPSLRLRDCRKAFASRRDPG